MTEQLKHECGIAMIRLRKPLEYYQEKYGTWQYGLNKLYLLMEKQHNRGQEGAGLAVVKLNTKPGEELVFRERAEGSGAISEIFASVQSHFKNIPLQRLQDVFYAKDKLPFVGELFLGHLRYSTTGKSGLSYVHPFLRRNNWISRTLVLAGNFNLTNVDELFDSLVAQGQHPREYADTFVMLESMGHTLDREVQYQYDKWSKTGACGEELNSLIEQNLDVKFILSQTASHWDGGYVIGGLIGCGDAFVFRDPNGIRPAFYYCDEEIVVVASERPVIQTTMNLEVDDISELLPGQAIVVKKDGSVSLPQVLEPAAKPTPCSFERIYFSRGSDADIYRERKELGRLLMPQILEAIDYDLEHTVFSFIPNTAEVAFYGMTESLDQYLQEQKMEAILKKGKSVGQADLQSILSRRIRTEKVALKDIKLRTFIAQDNNRDDLAAHVYDITYQSIEPFVDNLVVIDDSIVRGTTLRQSIIKMLDRLHPKKIIIVSSSPQIRFPDCYGIDMSRLSEFVAFKAAIALLREHNLQHIIDAVFNRSNAQRHKPKEEIINYVKEIYQPFTDSQIADKIAQIITPPTVQAKVQIVFQTIDNLHRACPNHHGDWYFSGNYPTSGGNRMVNTAFLNYIEGSNKRSYR